jgi:hypothetical protein
MLRRGVRQRSARCYDDDEKIAEIVADEWHDYDEPTRRALCRHLRLSVRASLRRRWAEVEALAAALLEHRTLSGEEARGVLCKVRLRDLWQFV